MQAFHYADSLMPNAQYADRRDIDLDSAFNDGYRLTGDGLRRAMLRWLVVGWSVAAWFMGSYMIAAALVHSLSRVGVVISTLLT